MVVNMASLPSMVEAVAGAAFSLGLCIGAWARARLAQAASAIRITQIFSLIFLGIVGRFGESVPCNRLHALAGS